MAHGVRLARGGHSVCRDSTEALALGKVFERAELNDRAEACYRFAADSDDIDTRGEALYRLGLRMRRDRRFAEAAAVWRDVLHFTEARHVRRRLADLRRFAAEALAIHHEHRERDLASAHELALFALEESDRGQADDVRRRLARLERKMGRSGVQQRLDQRL
jgi:hypothetical protein